MPVSAAASSSSISLPVPDNGQRTNTANSNEVNINEPDAFDAIINQLTALGSEIDQELSACKTNKQKHSSNSIEPDINNSTSYNSTNVAILNETNSLRPSANQSSSHELQYYSHPNSNMNQAVGNKPQINNGLTFFNNTNQNGGNFHQVYYHHQASGHLFGNGSVHHPSIGDVAPNVLDINSNLRTDSPDNDSAFSDSISLISSEQSSSSSSNSSTNGTSSARVRGGNGTNAMPNSGNTAAKAAIQSSQNGCGSTNVDSSNTVITSNDLNSNNCDIPSTPVKLSKQFSIKGQQCQPTSQQPQQELFFEHPNNSSEKSKDESLPSYSNSKKESEDASLVSIVHELECFVRDVQAQIEFHSLNDESKSSECNQSSDTNEVSGASNEPPLDDIIQVALDKIREANFRKLYIKIFAEDNSAKSLLADERMSIGDICCHLAEKNHIPNDIRQCIIEHMPQLYLERFYEDHESLVENVLYWSREGTNKLYFMQRNDKYDMFHKPERYLIGSESDSTSHNETLKSNSFGAKFGSNPGPTRQLRADLIGQFFRGNSVRVPEIESILYLRSEGKKVWKKYIFTLRSSGLYYCLKGKPKSTKDLICLTTFEMNCLYLGFGWKKKYKAPNDFSFAIKHPQIQSKSPKQIKYLCAETEEDLKLWTTGIRIAKYGKQLLDNFEKMKRIKLEGDNVLINDNQKSLTGLTLNEPNENGTPENYNHQSFNFHGDYQSVVMRQNRISSNESVRSSCDSSSSSGCMSEQSSVASTPSSGGNSSVSMINVTNVMSDSTTTQQSHVQLQQSSYMTSPTHHQPSNAFDTDFPLGTIKRKPSVSMIMQPKIPLTNTTRNLALQSDDALLEVENDGNANNLSNGSICNGSTVGHEEDYGSMYGDFQRFKSGTLLRRSNMDIKSSPMIGPSKLMSPYHQPHMQHQMIANSYSPVHKRQESDSSDDLPPPPPPLPGILKETESTLSLNNSFPPPPPPEVLQGNAASPLTPSALPAPPNCSISLSNLTSSSLQHLPHALSIQSMNQQSVVSPVHVPIPMTPQAQPKNANRLSRRLSDLSPSSTMYFNFRNQNIQQQQQQSFDCSQMPLSPSAMAPNSRASIAAGGDSYHNGYATLKSYNTNNRSLNRLQRQTIEAWNKYGTSPRIKTEPNRNMPIPKFNNGPIYDTYNANIYASGRQMQMIPPNGGNYGYAPYAGDNNNAQPDKMPMVNEIHQTREQIYMHNSQQNFNSNYNPQMGASGLPMNGQSHYAGPYVDSTMASSQMPPHSPGQIHQTPIKSRLEKDESHYMSISPHLLHKHQQMQQRQQQPDQQFFIRHHTQQSASYSGRNTFPEQSFLHNMEKVIQKKWNVAQMLNQEPSATPGQVLGFRDSAYLPPPPGCEQSQIQTQMNGNYSPQMKEYHSQSQSNVFFSSYIPNGTPSYVASFNNGHLPTSLSIEKQNQIYARSPGPKSVRISDNPTIINAPPSPSLSSNSSNSHYSSGMIGSNGIMKRVPPPPPKRSNSTQLTPH